MSNGTDSYHSRLNIGVELEKTDNGFLCELIMEGLTAAVSIIAPELLPADALEGVELEALCGIINDPIGALHNLTKGIRLGQRGLGDALPLPVALPAIE